MVTVPSLGSIPHLPGDVRILMTGCVPGIPDGRGVNDANLEVNFILETTHHWIRSRVQNNYKKLKNLYQTKIVQINLLRSN